MMIWTLLCLASFVWVLLMLRRDRASLGLPIAYLSSLLLIHLPGAIAHQVGGQLLSESDVTEIGFRLAAVGSICFAVGLSLARSPNAGAGVQRLTSYYRFSLFCLFGGWIFVFGLTAVIHVPSLSAVLEKGGSIWMLGLMLGLQGALERGSFRSVLIWISALAVYPAMILLLSGFLSYGATAVIIVFSSLAISTRRLWRVVICMAVAAFLGMTTFVNYFESRNEIRDAVWGGAPMMDRINTVSDAAANFHWFDLSNESDLIALDERLNQNYFVGLAAMRLQDGEVEFLDGYSLWEGLLALVPRVIWPEKPVTAGSPAIVSDMTGLELSEDASWGVGNVMEFYINFGWPGLVIGFVILGWLLGRLDGRAAAALSHGDLGSAILFFLPAVALIQPNGSLVEMTGGAAAALVAAYGWKWAWENWGNAKGAPPGSQRVDVSLPGARRALIADQERKLIRPLKPKARSQGTP